MPVCLPPAMSAGIAVLDLAGIHTNAAWMVLTPLATGFAELEVPTRRVSGVTTQKMHLCLFLSLDRADGCRPSKLVWYLSPIRCSTAPIQQSTHKKSCGPMGHIVFPAYAYALLTPVNSAWLSVGLTTERSWDRFPD